MKKYTYAYLLAAFLLGMGCEKMKQSQLILKCWDASTMKTNRHTPHYAEISDGIAQFADDNGFNRVNVADCSIFYGSQLNLP
jgi:hypothetical protein